MVIKMRRLFTVLALLLLITNCFATQLTGKVVDAGTKQAIDFANVSVVKGGAGDGVPVTGTITDASGSFTLSNSQTDNTR